MDPPHATPDEQQQQQQQQNPPQRQGEHAIHQQQHVEWETGYESVGDNLSSTVSSATSPATAQQQQRRMPLVSEASNPLLIDSVSEMTAPTLPAPQRVEPTLKEKLLERERQRRVETERARWKRQFALSNGSVEDDGGEEPTFLRENGSVIGTVGEESSVARNDLLEDEDEDEEDAAEPNTDSKLNTGNGSSNNNNSNNNNLGFTMERFLSETTGGGGGSAVVADVPTSQTTVNVAESDATIAGTTTPAPPDKGVVMERFLAEQMAIQQQQHQQHPPDMIPPISEVEAVVSQVGASVSFDALEPHTSGVDLAPSSLPDDEVADNVPSEHASSTPFRVSASSSTMNMHSSLANLSVIVNASMDDMGHTSIQSIPSFEALEEPDSPTGRTQSLGNMSTSSQAASEQHPMRVLRLTEAEIQELTAIEEASIGNAPPSERDDESDDSLVGELVGGARFDLTRGGMGIDPNTGTFSQGTQTTAMESVSIVSDVGLVLGTNHSSAPEATAGLHPNDSNSRLGHPHVNHHTEAASDQLVADHRSLDGIATGSSVSSHIVLSPGASSDDDDQQGGVSVTANPPSDVGDVEPPSILTPDDYAVDRNMVPDLGTLEATAPVPDTAFAQRIGRPPFVDDADEESLEIPNVAAGSNAAIVNRKIRPGMHANWTPPRRVSQKSPRFSGQSVNADDISPMKRSSSMPNARHMVVDGFDFDKNDPMRSPGLAIGEDSMRDLPGDDLWSSPAGKLNVSLFPLMRRHKEGNEAEDEEDEAMHPFYSSTAAMYGSTTVMSAPLPPPSGDYLLPSFSASNASKTWSLQPSQGTGEESQPLLREIPSGKPINDNNVQREDQDNVASRRSQHSQYPARASLDSVVGDAFREIQTDRPEIIAVVDSESAKYLQSGLLARAFSDRMFVLCVTFLVEIPVLLIVAGGSGRLCSLIGKKRYELMMGFLPLSSAIAGNVGLQSSMLTTRAISHEHVTLQSFPQWLTHEIGTAFILGFGMGSMLGLVACIASGGDFAFGITIMVAQIVSVVSAGCTGAVSPLLFSLIFRRDAEKWVAPLGTALQDVVGSFAMVILSYWMLAILGPRELNPSDVCGLT